MKIGLIDVDGHNFPNLTLMKISAKPDGHTVHDFDSRFALEDAGLISPSDKWLWGYLKDTPIQMKLNV